jgi:two-component system cell cycle response regulator
LFMRLRLGQLSGFALAFACCAALLVLYLALLGLGVHGAQLLGLNLANVVEFGAAGLVVARVIARHQGRGPWVPAALGMVCYSLGFVVYALVVERHHPIAYPSVSDALWLAIYPCLFMTIGLLARGVRGSRDAGLWLDGLVAALAVTALGSAIFFEPVLRSATGGSSAVATNLAYPFGDLTLLAFVTAALAITGGRPLRTWLLLSGGLAIFAVSDSIYVTLATTGHYTTGGLLDAGWPAGLLLVAAAAWQPQRALTPVVVGGLRRLVLAAPASAVALCLLVAGTRRVGMIAVELAVATLVATLVRATQAAILEHRLTATRLQAITDELTGLGNRRHFLKELETILASATAHDPHALVLFDLDGFKHFNDSFGHLAGDELLQTLAAQLAAAVGDSGRAYRLGGDEFCVLLAGDPRTLDETLPRLEDALSAERDGLQVGCSYGLALLPQEAGEVRAALALADRRMYERKDVQRRSTRMQMRDLLLAAVEEQQPHLLNHSTDVSYLCRQVGSGLGLSAIELDQLAHAAELHDVGKLAIPQAILAKPGPLTPEEWELMRQHTLIGERILRRAPALSRVATIVRSTHERFDGTGYPDRLCGEEIPLEARIVAVCDAYAAMLAARPYRRARSSQEAQEELRRNAGTQFDPAVVDAFTATACNRAQPPAALSRTSPSAPPEPRLTTIASLRGLLELRRLARSNESLEVVLDATARIIADSLGLGTVVINLRRPGTDLFDVTTVHGADVVRDVLLGTTNPLSVWKELLHERYHRRGAYHIRAGEFDWEALGGSRAVVGEVAGSDPWLWNPEDELFFPFYASDGSLLGVFSVGEPSSRRRPSDDELDILVAIAEHAADAIEPLFPGTSSRLQIVNA